jgi:PAS domain S-box-containing protein
MMSTAAGLVGLEARRLSAVSLRFYSLGLATTALGLAGAFLASPGSPLSWAGRGAQYAGNLYLLAAILIFIRLARRQQVGLRLAVAEFFSESADHYQSLVDNMEKAVVSIDPAGNVFLWNPAAERIFGYPADEAMGRPFTDLVASSQAEDRLRAALDSAGKAAFEVPLRRKDGSTFVAEMSPFSAGRAGSSVIVQDITDRRSAEDALRRAYEQRRLALEAAEMGAWDYRFETGEVYWDQRCRLMWGVPDCDQISYDAVIDRIHPEDRSAVDTAVKRAVDGADDGAYRQEFRVVWPDGTVRWVSSHGRVFFRNEGSQRRAVRFIGANRDITDRREIEAAAMEARRQKDFVAEVVELSSQAFAVGYPDGRLGLFNQAFERLTGYAGEELHRMDWQHVLTPPEWHADEQSMLEKLRRTGKAVTYRKEYIRKDKSRIPVELLVGAIVDSQGDVSYYYAFITDITERLQTEGAIQRSLQRLEILASSTADLLKTSDPRGLVSSICSRVMAHLDCEAFFNHVYDEQIGKLSLNACGGEPLIQQSLMRLDFGKSMCFCAREGRRFIPGHAESTSDDPCMRALSPLGIRAFACHPLFDDGEKVIGTLAFGSRNRDAFEVEDLLLMQAVSDQISTALVRVRGENALRQSEQALQRANESLEQRVAERTDMLERTISILHREAEERRKTAGELSAANHQLEARAGQLRALAGELTMAEHRERHRTGKILHDHLQQILSSAKMQVSCLRRERDVPLDAVARIEEVIGEAIQVTRSLTGELSPPILQVAGLKAGLEWLARRTAERLGVEVAVRADCDPALSEQTKILVFESVRELLFNCAKHSGAGRAGVRVVCDEATLHVTVSDSGSGFDPQCLTTPGDTRTGFGLFGIRERIQLVGGSFEIESAPNAGSRFHMCLPLTDSGPVAALPPHITSSEGGIRVLIADDHAIMLEGLTVMLSKEPDIEVVGQARDGRQAIEMTRRLTPDVVLMDIGMPGLNGIEATRIIRAEMPRVRVLGLSMLYEEGEGAEAMREAGAIAYVTKSAPSSEVLAALRSCMSGGGNEPVQRHEPYV